MVFLVVTSFLSKPSTRMLFFINLSTLLWNPTFCHFCKDLQFWDPWVSPKTLILKMYRGQLCNPSFDYSRWAVKIGNLHWHDSHEIPVSLTGSLIFIAMFESWDTWGSSYHPLQLSEKCAVVVVFRSFHIFHSDLSWVFFHWIMTPLMLQKSRQLTTTTEKTWR